MDHAYIEENGLVERYHRGLLDPEEEARFEEHFVDCARCTEQLELARGFQKGLKVMVAEDAARAAVIQAGLFAWLARRARLAQWGLALAALLLAAGLPSLWLLAQGREQRQAAAAGLEAERRNAAGLERRLSESERRRSEERRELEGRIATSRPPEAPRGLAGPLVNTPVFLLTAVRGDEGKPATVDPGRAGDALALAVDVGPDAGFEAYRATITKASGGTAVFQRAGLKPNALEALMITFPASFFAPGEYRLRVEGVRPDGSASEVGSYPFRVKGKG
ncbi:MAG: zf-HC2 domain-containing protein [Thermoanaerobaculia bacterium]